MRWSKNKKEKVGAKDVEKLDETEQLLPGMIIYTEEARNDPATDIERLAKLARDSG